MSWQRRAAAPRLIDWTGERCVPWAPDVQVVYEHFHRYLWAAPIVAGRRVLDLGSGEGFGAAILAETAADVVGVDIDKRTVEHSKLNYAASNLEFRVGTALDLSTHDTGGFGAVVAFEIIEHVRDQERLLGEVVRVLNDDGLLVISTPDRRVYSEASGQSNPFHERELALEEFVELLKAHFPYVSAWGQRTITGSHMNILSRAQGDVGTTDIHDFFIERADDEWRVAGDAAALYCIAVASKVALPAPPDASTLADCGLELMRLRERDAVIAQGERDIATRRSEGLEHERDEVLRALEQERAAHHRMLRQRESEINEELTQREHDIGFRQETIVNLNQKIAGLRGAFAELETELTDARQLSRRTEESVTWQAFQKVRARLYNAIGERSLLSRALGISLRLVGRVLVKRPAQKSLSPASDPPAIETISLPEYEHPKVSLIIPLYAHAELTRACLQSIRDNTSHAGYEVILVDDTADAATKRLLEGVSGARVIHNEKNLGYLRSINRGAGVARGRWLVLFNNDTEVTRNWLQAMLSCAESAEDVGIVTPKFVYPDGSLNEAGGIVWRDGTGVNYGRGDVASHFQYEYRRETDYGSAAALMVSAELWQETGGFDERYLPMYYEDTDLCFEAREHGLRVLYEPEAVIVHIEGATAGNDAESGYKRYQERNRSKFVAKWRRQLESEHLRPALHNVRIAANRQRGRHVLVVDYRVPMWDYDSGSLRVLGIMRGLLGLGVRVTFMPDNLAPLQPYTRVLQQMGIEVLYGGLDVNAELATLGPKLSLAILSRPHVASRWLDVVREFAPSAKIVYDTVDLHWLREARKSSLDMSSWGALGIGNGSPDLMMSPKAQALRYLELAMIQAADTTFVVTDSERLQVERDVPGADVRVMPNVHDVEPYVAPPEGRSGVLFVGGFAHPPNIDAAVRLVRDVMPAVWRELGDVRVTIAGSQPPPEIEALASPLVDVTGWIEDLQPLLERARLMVAPLRYGAGLKGKVTQSLAVGLPVVTTPIGAEGLQDPDECMLVAEDARTLAEHVVRAYCDDELWWRLSRAGQAFINAHCSSDVITDQLRSLLEDVPILTDSARAAT
jgi:GT2 family glycosyltransferase/SAM-dependent methyltransferase